MKHRTIIVGVASVAAILVLSLLRAHWVVFALGGICASGCLVLALRRDRRAREMVSE